MGAGECPVKTPSPPGPYRTLTCAPCSPGHGTSVHVHRGWPSAWGWPWQCRLQVCSTLELGMVPVKNRSLHC